MTEESAENFDLGDLLRRGVCPMCMTPAADLEPSEFIQNGMHSFCVVQDVAGHTVDACWCSKGCAGMSKREISILAAERFKALQFRGRYGAT